MSITSDFESELGWPDATRIDKDELIKLILLFNPDQTKKQVGNHVRYYQKNQRARHRLPPGSSFDNKIAADWIRAVHPKIARLDGFPKYPETGYLDSEYDTIVVPSLDDLPEAHMQCQKENLRLKKRNRVLEEENGRLKREETKRGPKPKTDVTQFTLRNPKMAE